MIGRLDQRFALDLYLDLPGRPVLVVVVLDRDPGLLHALDHQLAHLGVAVLGLVERRDVPLVVELGTAG